MVRVESQHTQWAVGQGFFRTGRIQADHVIDYAYDCGSTNLSACRAEIKAYAGLPHGSKPLDVVYLSHFHADHVNCVPDLVRDIGVKRFVIPLVSPAERLMVYAQSLQAPDDWEAAWYRELIVDPVDALQGLRQGVEVIVVSPDATAPPVEDPDEVPNEESAAEVSWSAPTVSSPTSSLSVAGWGSRPLWVWIPHVLSDARAHTSAFIQALAGELGTPRLLLGKKLKDPGYLRGIVERRSGALKTAYQIATKDDLNLTSLCLYSGPAAPYRPSGARSHRSRKGGLDRLEVAAWSVRAGWFGTGDAPLRGSARTTELASKFHRFLDNVGVLALPHHGSRKNLDGAFLDLFDNDVRPTCLVSAGVGNSYKHPHGEVVQAIADRGFHLVLVTGNERSRWTTSATSFL